MYMGYGLYAFVIGMRLVLNPLPATHEVIWCQIEVQTHRLLLMI
jgi:hypothetical protein